MILKTEKDITIVKPVVSATILKTDKKPVKVKVLDSENAKLIVRKTPIKLKSEAKNVILKTQKQITKLDIVEGGTYTFNYYTTDIEVLAGEIIGGQRAVIVNNNTAYYADNTNLDHKKYFIGISKHAVQSIGSRLNVAVKGEFTEPSWNWEYDKPIYLGTNGMLTQTPPLVGLVFVLGYVITPTKIFIDIKLPFTRV